MPPLPMEVSRVCCVASDLADLEGWGMSKICRVDLSDVAASCRLDGDIARENIVA